MHTHKHTLTPPTPHPQTHTCTHAHTPAADPRVRWCLLGLTAPACVHVQPPPHSSTQTHTHTFIHANTHAHLQLVLMHDGALSAGLHQRVCTSTLTPPPHTHSSTRAHTRTCSWSSCAMAPSRLDCTSACTCCSAAASEASAACICWDADMFTGVWASWPAHVCALWRHDGKAEARGAGHPASLHTVRSLPWAPCVCIVHPPPPCLLHSCAGALGVPNTSPHLCLLHSCAGAFGVRNTSPHLCTLARILEL